MCVCVCAQWWYNPFVRMNKIQCMTATHTWSLWKCTVHSTTYYIAWLHTTVVRPSCLQPIQCDTIRIKRNYKMMAETERERERRGERKKCLRTNECERGEKIACDLDWLNFSQHIRDISGLHTHTSCIQTLGQFCTYTFLVLDQSVRFTIFKCEILRNRMATKRTTAWNQIAAQRSVIVFYYLFLTMG